MTANLPKRRLGASDLEVSAVGLGCMSLSGIYGESSDDNGIAVVHAALDAGINFLDSADMYGWGHNETLLGKALKGRRDEVVLASKFAQVRQEGGGNGVDGRPEYVVAACEASLARLATDHIDLYYMHRIDPKVPIEETVGALSELVAEGKIRYIGLCEASAPSIRRAHAVHPITAVQTEYSLFERGIEQDGVRDTLQELGIGLVAYSPLGRGFLSGAITSPDDFAEDDWRWTDPRFQGENFDRNLDVVREVRRIASDRNLTPSQLALAWVQYQGAVAIPGTKRRRYLEENVAATEMTLTAEDDAAIEAVAPHGVVTGDRYAPEYMGTLNG
jgi:aryl-alcohol dehydrogenase-like predicted oxidoreductase